MAETGHTIFATPKTAPLLGEKGFGNGERGESKNYGISSNTECGCKGGCSNLHTHTSSHSPFTKGEAGGGGSQGRGVLGYHMVSGPRYVAQRLYYTSPRGSPRVERESYREVFRVIHMWVQAKNNAFGPAPALERRGGQGRREGAAAMKALSRTRGGCREGAMYHTHTVPPVKEK